MMANKTTKNITAQGQKQAADGRVILPADYKPSESEAFMNPLQVEYFRQN